MLMDTTLEQLPLLFDLAHEMDSNLKLTHALAVIPGAGIRLRLSVPRQSWAQRWSSKPASGQDRQCHASSAQIPRNDADAAAATLD
ncbi:MAG: hypothetical protein R2838_03690 [Caldilineaceae bacterium]